ncbi:hypothetical protein EJC51_46745 [Streptomyces aquilus]|uniref:Uncharacterized protein n=1 Tax=Streptomyces aquilus TaxID=2548456 RepID=A0A3Q9C7Q3_9ACTN|nr:hypothetical protein [Streptomyces aquilus]AZP22877.1 hypothetical protein EJC51_46745 [Streptomyces aquilus]
MDGLREGADRIQAELAVAEQEQQEWVIARRRVDAGCHITESLDSVTKAVGKHRHTVHKWVPCIASPRWKGNPLRASSHPVLDLARVVLQVFSPILSGLIEAELRPQGQEQTDKG